jgi:hypothetical protein
MMQLYRNIGGDSGVLAYEYGTDFIRVKFSTGTVYLYTNASAGPQNISEMKKLADAGKGLNAFINLKVKKLYARTEM